MVICHPFSKELTDFTLFVPLHATVSFKSEACMALLQFPVGINVRSVISQIFFEFEELTEKDYKPFECHLSAQMPH